LKARLSPSAPFGLGLRLSASEASELLREDYLSRFRRFLDHEGLYVALINGFPYGPFHGTPVKTTVYAPDWRTPARLEYTLNLIRILQRLLPDGIDGGVSTSPLSYKPWMTSGDPEEWNRITEHVVSVAEALVRVRQEQGALVHLDIGPGTRLPHREHQRDNCVFRALAPIRSAPKLARRLGVSDDDARDRCANTFACASTVATFPSSSRDRSTRSPVSFMPAFRSAESSSARPAHQPARGRGRGGRGRRAFAAVRRDHLLAPGRGARGDAAPASLP
jgi:hypothetical protein